MIDDKKIEEAANKHIETEYARYNSGEVEEEMICLRGKDSFKAGAKWAINALFKNLWHPASEKPLLRNGKCLVVYNSGNVDIFSISFVYEMLSDYGKDDMGWKCWCYISDLFPKEVGNHD